MQQICALKEAWKLIRDLKNHLEQHGELPDPPHSILLQGILITARTQIYSLQSSNPERFLKELREKG